MGLRLFYQFSECECIEISWTCSVCLPSHPCWCCINCTKIQINSVLGCTLRITSRSREVILPLCLAPVRHISSAGSSCGLPVQERWGHTGPAKAIALGLQCPSGVGGGEKRRRRILCCLQIPNGVRTRQCQPLSGCPEKVQESGGKCQECVGKTFLQGLLRQQGSRGAVKLLPWQIVIN